MRCVSVVLPTWAVESGEVRLAVGELWRPALVAVPTAEVTPVGERVGIAGVTWRATPNPNGGASRRPEYGWVASSVATVAVEERVEDGRMVGQLPVTAMEAGGIRFAIEGTYEGRWRCSACTFEHLPQVLDETSPVLAAEAMNLRVARIVRFDRDGDARLPVEVSDMGSSLLEAVSHFVVDVRT